MQAAALLLQQKNLQLQGDDVLHGSPALIFTPRIALLDVLIPEAFVCCSAFLLCAISLRAALPVAGEKSRVDSDS